MNSLISELRAAAYTIPTEGVESDGTFEWKDTTMVVVRVRSGELEGLGYTYGNAVIGKLILSGLGPVVIGKDPMDVMGLQQAMVARIRNEGQCGLAMMAVSAVDIAIWDLKAKLLELPLCRLLGQQRESMLIYGSGGFTSYTEDQLADQLSSWVRQGIKAVKIKVGRDNAADIGRVDAAREAIGKDPALFVDANAAYTVNEAIRQAERFSVYGVNWLEEPVPASAIPQLRLIRDQLPAGMRLVAGEYGYSPDDFRALLEDHAVDILQADATRCGGITGFIKAGYLAEAFRVPLSSHCAPALHLHPALALSSFSIAEYFHDHVLIEERFLDGICSPREGQIIPDLRLPGLGLQFRDEEAEPYRVA